MNFLTILPIINAMSQTRRKEMNEEKETIEEEQDTIIKEPQFRQRKDRTGFIIGGVAVLLVVGVFTNGFGLLPEKEAKVKVEETETQTQEQAQQQPQQAQQPQAIGQLTFSIDGQEIFLSSRELRQLTDGELARINFYMSFYRLPLTQSMRQALDEKCLNWLKDRKFE